MGEMEATLAAARLFKQKTWKPLVSHYLLPFPILTLSALPLIRISLTIAPSRQCPLKLLLATLVAPLPVQSAMARLPLAVKQVDIWQHLPSNVLVPRSTAVSLVLDAEQEQHIQALLELITHLLKVAILMYPEPRLSISPMSYLAASFCLKEVPARQSLATLKGLLATARPT